MRKLWSAANVKIYGGGVDDATFLRQISDLVGTYEHETSSRSSGRSGTTRSAQTTERPVPKVDQLRRMRQRAVLLASGTPPLLIKPQVGFNTDLKKRLATARAQTQTQGGAPAGQAAADRRDETEPAA